MLSKFFSRSFLSHKKKLIANSKRFYTLKHLTNPLFQEKSFTNIYKKLVDPTSLYSKMFVCEFIDKIDKINMNYGESSINLHEKLKNAYFIHDTISKYYNYWNEFPDNFKTINCNVQCILDIKKHKYSMILII